ncbi:MAG: YezD family protein [Succinivibrionaceae bacterium]|nr:YezD family protein [Succinivibrionaceae bacterium]
MSQNSDNAKADNQPDKRSLKVVEDLIQGVKYGSVLIIIQDGKIVQIEKTEKVRLTSK